MELTFVLKLPSFPLSPDSKLRNHELTFALELPSFPVSPGSPFSP